MRRVGHLFEQVASFQALRAAFERARQGKAGTPSVERFARRLEPELFALEAELLAGTWRPGPTVTFEVWDPKRRTITVAPFRDRVVHHALVAAIGPTLERGMDPDSYGCRVGKGTDGALARAVALARRHPWALRADVAAFFASIPHGPLLAQLRRLFKDARLLALLEHTVRADGVSSGGGDPPKSGDQGRGLPIGHLTSQWLANLYLTPLDRRLRTHPDVRGYVRYMDDLVVFGPSAPALRGVRDALSACLADPLGLSLNTRVTRAHRVRAGFPFLGFTVRPGGLRLRSPTWRRLRRGVAARERLLRRGALDEAGLQAAVQSTLAHVGRADSPGLRRTWLAREPPAVW